LDAGVHVLLASVERTRRLLVLLIEEGVIESRILTD